MSALTDSAAWRALQQHQRDVAALHMRSLFAAEPDRFQRFSLEAADLLLDYSKNRITGATLPLLFDLAADAGLDRWRTAMFDGEKWALK